MEHPSCLLTSSTRVMRLPRSSYTPRAPSCLMSEQVKRHHRYVLGQSLTLLFCCSSDGTASTNTRRSWLGQTAHFSDTPVNSVLLPGFSCWD